MILAVTGGRDFKDAEMVDRNLRRFVTTPYKQNLIIQGGALGLDSLVYDWGWKHGIHVAEVRAQWGTYGRAAGHYRNHAMLLLKPELLLAFPGGRGTANAVARAEELGIPVEYAK